MFGWRNLTRRQKIGGAFLLVLFLIGSPLLLIFPATTAEGLQDAGCVLCGWAVLLDPQWFRLGHGVPVILTAMPRTCRILMMLGLPLAAAGFLMSHHFLGVG
jgi:hypothetical protein